MGHGKWQQVLGTRWQKQQQQQQTHVSPDVASALSRETGDSRVCQHEHRKRGAVLDAVQENESGLAWRGHGVWFRWGDAQVSSGGRVLIKCWNDLCKYLKRTQQEEERKRANTRVQAHWSLTSEEQ